MPYIENESFAHKKAKELFKEWIDNWGDGNNGFNLPLMYNGHKTYLWIRSNRSENAWLEYPVVVKGDMNADMFDECWLMHNDINKRPINSIKRCWDELWGCENRMKQCGFGGREDGFVPNYQQCKNNGMNPVRVIDVVLPHKGTIKYFIEICHKNPVPDDKVKQLKLLGVEQLMEIDASWILNQTKIPKFIKIKRWLIGDDYKKLVPLD